MPDNALKRERDSLRASHYLRASLAEAVLKAQASLDIFALTCFQFQGYYTI